MKTNPHLVFLNGGVVHQADIIVDVEAEQRTWKKTDELSPKAVTQLFQNVIETKPGTVYGLAESCGSLTRFASGFGHDEVVETVVLKETNR